MIAAIISQSVAVNFCDKSSCSLSADYIELDITYTNQCEDTKTRVLNVTGGAGNCTCSGTFSTITLTGNDTIGVKYTVIFTFSKAADGATWSHNVTVNVATDLIPHILNITSCGGQATGYLLQNNSYFGNSIAGNNGFQCSQASLGSNGTTCSSVQNLNISMTNWKIMPFSTSTNYQTCNPDITSIIVPIAVGAALAGLVVLVIVVWIAGKLWEKYKAKKSGGVSYDKL